MKANYSQRIQVLHKEEPYQVFMQNMTLDGLEKVIQDKYHRQFLRKHRKSLSCKNQSEFSPIC